MPVVLKCNEDCYTASLQEAEDTVQRRIIPQTVAQLLFRKLCKGQNFIAITSLTLAVPLAQNAVV